MRALLRGGGSGTADWVAVSVRPAVIDVAQIQAGASGRPIVRMCEAIPCSGGQAEVLGRLGRKLRASRFRCSNLLDPGHYQMQLVEAPAVPEAELKQAVRWKLKDMLDYPVDTATVDIAHVPDGRTNGSRVHYVYAVSARNDHIAAQIKLFQDAHFRLEAIDVPEMAQRNIARLYEEPDRGVALLSFDAHGGMLTFTSGGALYMSRRTDIALSQLDAHAGDARERLVLELQRSLDHFDRQFSQIALSRLLLAPVAVDGLQEYLAEHLYLPVSRLDLDEVMDLSETPALRDPARQLEALHVLGAAMRQL